MSTDFDDFSGELIWPGNDAFESARLVYNRRIDMRPALIARCRGNADVISALRWARRRGLEIAVRCAGNNYNGFSTSQGGLVIDLSLMRSVRVAPASKIARIGGGTLMGDVLREAALFELAPAIGVGSAVGLGLLLGGGFGYLRNRAGWGADNIIGADMVVADGRLIRATVDENPDMLWALRGAGANFGVVTSLDVQLHDMPRSIRTGTMIWGEERLEEGMRAIRDVAARASEDFSITGWLTIATNPELGRLTDKPNLEAVYCHWGSAAQAVAEIDGLNSAGRPDFHEVGTTSFVELHERFSVLPKRIEWDAVAVRQLDDEAIGVLAAIARTMARPGAFRCIELFDLRGAPSREPAIPSAQPRSLASSWSVRPGASSAGPEHDAENDAWVHEVMAAVLATDSGIADPCALNSTSWLPDEARIRAHYGAGMERLLQLKRKWDPDNVFRKNQNIDPNWA